MEETNKKKELTYDELKRVAGQLSQQNQQLNMMLQQANMTNTFKRLDYLFEVLNHKDCFSTEFVIKCSDEIVDMMTPPADDPSEDEGKEA